MIKQNKSVIIQFSNIRIDLLIYRQYKLYHFIFIIHNNFNEISNSL